VAYASGSLIRDPSGTAVAPNRVKGGRRVFAFLGKIVARTWPFLLAAWGAALVGLWFFAPSWDKVGKSGQFAYLPADAPTRRAEQLFDEAFPGQRSGSGIVLVVTRTDGGELRPEDRRFVNETLAPRVKQEFLATGQPAAGSPVMRVRA